MGVFYSHPRKTGTIGIALCTPDERLLLIVLRVNSIWLLVIKTFSIDQTIVLQCRVGVFLSVNGIKLQITERRSQ